MNRGRIAFGHLLDLHAALFGRHHHRHADAAVERDAEVELLIDVERFLDENLADFASLGAGLVRDQRHADHLLRQFRGFIGVLGEFHAAALAAAAGMDLRFHDDASAQLLRRGARVISVIRDDAARRRNAVAAQDFFGLILVDFHRARSFITSNATRAGAPESCITLRRPEVRDADR